MEKGRSDVLPRLLDHLPVMATLLDPAARGRVIPVDAGSSDPDSNKLDTPEILGLFERLSKKVAVLLG